MPLGIKDLFCTEGVRTTAGSNILGDFTPTYESTVTANLWRDGAVMLGKLNMDEFAMGSSNETSRFGPVVNPWRARGSNRPLTPGGSSGGSAAAVAADLCLAATATDTGGSIRQPAALHRHGRHQADLRPLLALGHRRLRLVARPGRADRQDGRGRGDPAALDGRPRPEGLHQPAGRGAGLRQLRRQVGEGPARSACRRNTASTACRPRSRRCGQQGVDWLKDAGCEIVDVSLPHTKYALPAYYIIAPAEASSNLARYDGMRYGLRVDGDDADRHLRGDPRRRLRRRRCERRILIGTYVLSAGYYDAYYLKAQKVRRRIADDFDQAFEKVDALLTPTAPSAAFGLGENAADPVAMYLNDIFTVTVNLAGLPGLSVPAGLDAQGLPLGLQLIGRALDEGTLFRSARRSRRRPTSAPSRRPGGGLERRALKPGGYGEQGGDEDGGEQPHRAGR